MKRAQSWFARKNISSIIETSEIDGNVYHHLQTPVQFLFSKNIIDTLKTEYDAKFEKGGFFLGKPQKTENGVIILIDQVEFIQNAHSEPESKYRYESESFSQKIKLAFENGVFPLMFHTHPTASENIVGEQYKFLQQLNTSIQDQTASSYSYTIENKKLILPCVLVVGNGSNINSIFIGFYNGLIAPKIFSEHKEEIMQETTNVLIESSKKVWEKDENKALILIGVLLLILMIAKYPKTSVFIAIGLAALAPTMAISNQERNLYFGITHGNELLIEIPSNN